MDIKKLRKQAASKNDSQAIEAMNVLVNQYIDACMDGDSPEVSFTEALYYCKELMHRDVVEGYTFAAGIFQHGLGCPIDISQAMKYYSEGSKKGFPYCELGLGRLYYNNGDLAQAEKCFLEAGKSDEILDLSEVSLAVLYHEKKDFTKSVQYCMRLNNCSHPEIKALLGKMYITGEGVTQDLNKGLSLVKESAFLGADLGIYFLSLLYKNGIGVPKDEEFAEKLETLSDFCAKTGIKVSLSFDDSESD